MKIMRCKWLCLLLPLVFVSCTYDDSNLDRYVKNGAKSIDEQKAIEILSKDRGFWSVNGKKSYVRVINEDGTSEMIPRSEIDLYGNNSYFIYQFDEDGKVTAYHYTDFPKPKWRIYDAEIVWDKKIVKADTYEFMLKGVTENYFIVEEKVDNWVNAKFIFIDVYDRMLDADITRFLNKTEFVDKRE